MLKSPSVCGSGCFEEKRECLQKMLPSEEVARCRSKILHRSSHASLMVVWYFCCYWRAESKTPVLNEGVLRKRKCLADFPSLCCPERWSRLNRISHSDWVKLCVDPNGRIKLRAKRKCEIISATLLITPGLQGEQLLLQQPPLSRKRLKPLRTV